MRRSSSAPFFVAALIVLGGIVVLLNDDTSSPGEASSTLDCTAFTATPTVSPSPTPTPAWRPYSATFVCNDTGQAVSDLHIVLSGDADEVTIGDFGIGCPAPSYVVGPAPEAFRTADIDWGAPCIDAGEGVYVDFYAPCMTPEPRCDIPRVSCFYWTLDGERVFASTPAINPPTCPAASPVDTGSPSPTQMPCPERDLEPSEAPTATPATPTPTPGPTSRDVILTVTIPFCNDSGENASDLHVIFSYAYSSFTVEDNPAGCPEPSSDPDPGTLDDYSLDIDWGTDCVQPGQSLTLDFLYACGDVPCKTPAPFCYTWTRFGEPLDSGPGDCEFATPTPTPTPTARPPGTVTPTPACPAGHLPDGSCAPCPTAQPIVPGGPVVNSTCPPLPTPTPTPGFALRWGDLDCNGGVGSVDALKTLRLIVGLPFDQRQPCPAAGNLIYVGEETVPWGDVDCDGEITSGDALWLLRFVVRIPFYTIGTCPEIGQDYPV